MIKNNPFNVNINEIEFIKAISPDKCDAVYHNYGVRKYGFCANCNSSIFNYN